MTILVYNISYHEMEGAAADATALPDLGQYEGVSHIDLGGEDSWKRGAPADVCSISCAHYVMAVNGYEPMTAQEYGELCWGRGDGPPLSRKDEWVRRNADGEPVWVASFGATRFFEPDDAPTDTNPCVVCGASCVEVQE